jgi:hypothetical protein
MAAGRLRHARAAAEGCRVHPIALTRCTLHCLHGWEPSGRGGTKLKLAKKISCKNEIYRKKSQRSEKVRFSTSQNFTYPVSILIVFSLHPTPTNFFNIFSTDLCYPYLSFPFLFLSFSFSEEEEERGEIREKSISMDMG